MLETVKLCPQLPEDRAFLFALFAESRRPIFTGLPDDLVETLLRQQFEFQSTGYFQLYPKASFNVVKIGQNTIGRLAVDKSDEGIRVIDIALLKAYRNQGIGSFLIETLLAEARITGIGVYLSVERHNPALRWYERLGFKLVQDNEVYLELEWQPDVKDA